MVLAGVQLGNVAEWVGAIGTVGALIAAVLLLRKELTSLEVDRMAQADERAARAEERELRRREHARTVAVWLDDRKVSYSSRVHDFETKICVKNASSWPVDNCVAYVLHPIGGPPDDPAAHEAYEVVMGTVPPGERLDHDVPQAYIDRGRVIFPGLLAEVTFTDSAGIHWRRRVDGSLEEQEHPPRIC